MFMGNAGRSRALSVFAYMRFIDKAFPKMINLSLYRKMNEIASGYHSHPSLLKRLKRFYPLYKTIFETIILVTTLSRLNIEDYAS